MLALDPDHFIHHGEERHEEERRDREAYMQAMQVCDASHCAHDDAAFCAAGIDNHMHGRVIQLGRPGTSAHVLPCLTLLQFCCHTKGPQPTTLESEAGMSDMSCLTVQAAHQRMLEEIDPDVCLHKTGKNQDGKVQGGEQKERGQVHDPFHPCV